VATHVIHDLIRKFANHQSADASTPSARRNGADVGVPFDPLAGFSYCREKLKAEAGSVFLVPVNRVREFRIRFRDAKDARAYRFRISFSMRRSTSSQGTSSARPASMSSIRRSTSAAHAASTSSSGSPSRLARSFAARSARSRVSSVNASVKIFSAAFVTSPVYDSAGHLTSRWSGPASEAGTCIRGDMAAGRSAPIR
jgi:hypothetical protein